MKKDGTKTIITVLLTILILGACYLYIKKTAPLRAYKAEIKQLKLISEHQGLDIEVALQRAKLEAMKKAVQDAIPKMRLLPEDPNQ